MLVGKHSLNQYQFMWEQLQTIIKSCHKKQKHIRTGFIL